MSTIVTRSGKGSPLTNTEVDANFTNLNTGKAELSGAVFTGAITTNSTIDGRDVAADGVTADAALPKAGGAMTGAITTNSTFDGRDVATDGTKLDGVEASADVTDTANVTAAGALMDSELTAIASVKALNQGVATGDSPTFAALTSTGEIVANGGIALGDSDKATFGASDDLQIYHDGNNSIIRDVGTGDLRVQGANIQLLSSNGKKYLYGVEDAYTKLYYDNAEKLATTATGIDVTGTATMDGLTVNDTSGASVTHGYSLINSAARTGSGSIQLSSIPSVAMLLDYHDADQTVATVRNTYGATTVEAELSLDSGFITFNTGTSFTERFRIAADGSLSTPTLGTSNVRFGVNAGNSIASGGNYNTVVGDEAGTALTTGDYSTFVGYGAGDAINTADYNTVVGANALSAETKGNRSVAVGMNALLAQNFTSSTDAYNVAVGMSAGAAVTTGTKNTLVGGLAGDAITTANANTAVGYASLGANTTGTSNVALGYEAMLTNTTADNNTAVGLRALKLNTTGASNVALGTSALEANTTASNNTAVGKSALTANTTGASNVAVGALALDANTTGASNVGVGTNALTSNTTATANAALGYSALYTNTTGVNNTALGFEALALSTTASNNTAVGKDALRSNTTGTANVAVGALAGDALTTGGSNVAIGYNSLSSEDEHGGNVAVGTNVLATQNAGATGYNTAVGHNTGLSVTTGVQNTIIGGLAGDAITTGTQNILIGYVATASAVGAGNQTVIGAGVTSVGNGNFTFGSGTSDSNIANGATSISAPSDQRYKEEIADATAGLSFINDLRPVTFKWKKEKDLPTEHRAYVKGSENRTMNDYTNHGFIAQEVKTVIDAHSEIKDGFDMWSTDDQASGGRQRLADNALVPILVKAIQEQTALITALTARITTLEG
jgi:hypothetical protein